MDLQYSNELLPFYMQVDIVNNAENYGLQKKGILVMAGTMTQEVQSVIQFYQRGIVTEEALCFETLLNKMASEITDRIITVPSICRQRLKYLNGHVFLRSQGIPGKKSP